MVQTLTVPDPLADLAQLEGVPSAVTAARDAVDAVLRDRGLRMITAEQSAQALLAGARASAELDDDTDRWLAGSVRLSTELLALSSLILVAPGQAISRAHTLVARGEVEDDDLGRIRLDPEVSARMTGLNRLLSQSSPTSALVLAGIAHAEVATVAPFGAANGIVARAVEHMVLIACGVDPRAVIVVEAGHLSQGATYEAALAAYRDGSVAGVRNWIVRCAQAVTRGTELSPLAH